MLYRSLQHTRLRRRKNRTVYAVLNLKQNLRSTYCSEANDRHEASRGLFATAELLVLRHSVVLSVWLISDYMTVTAEPNDCVSAVMTIITTHWEEWHLKLLRQDRNHWDYRTHFTWDYHDTTRTRIPSMTELTWIDTLSTDLWCRKQTVILTRCAVSHVGLRARRWTLTVDYLSLLTFHSNKAIIAMPASLTLFYSYGVRSGFYVGFSSVFSKLESFFIS